MTCALNAANEKANELLREGKYDFFGIPKVAEISPRYHRDITLAEISPRYIHHPLNQVSTNLIISTDHPLMTAHQVIEQTMAAHEKDWTATPSLDDIVAVDTWARQQVVAEAERLKSAPVLL